MEEKYRSIIDDTPQLINRKINNKQHMQKGCQTLHDNIGKLINNYMNKEN